MTITMPSILDNFSPVYIEVVRKTDAAIMTIKLEYISPEKVRGSITALIPITINMLKVLDPITFPRAISDSSLNAATLVVESSGREVANAMMVSPTTPSMSANLFI